ncbi:TIGR01906 family membrane protein [Vallitalea guaymasensis]|mgnify:CR=1 FL=1|uniref:TIGR01906 family membrane protein n=1 Tax=Vallitalea guaymasensis TaxID=1185412 RepID=A0A8J8SE99_9FIRM|nr:TIGR01906 family membrane protein [Vallitalea guaymasensis]QUH31316.1 TIGR01906 family membrane protein [Vallitalea guaymasensis]
MKCLNIGVSIIIGVLLFFVLLFTSAEVIAYNINHYQWQYERHDIPEQTNMSLDELTKVTKNMIAYLKDSRKTLDMKAVIDGKEQEVFGEREKSHMVDVKKLFVIGTYMRNISFIILVIAIGYMVFRNKKLLTITFSMVKYVFAVIIMLILILSGLLLIDFNKYFTIFHEIFFSNDLWLLDPKTDILINIVPEIFFFQTAMIILGIFVVSVVVTLVIIEVAKKKLIRHYH